MSPQPGKEVQLTDLETKIMSVFVKEKILNDKDVVAILSQLIWKLEGSFFKY